MYVILEFRHFFLSPSFFYSNVYFNPFVPELNSIIFFGNFDWPSAVTRSRQFKANSRQRTAFSYRSARFIYREILPSNQDYLVSFDSFR